ncbi:MAG: sialate O-acetylesterase [Flavobacteriaceae bacterium]
MRFIYLFVFLLSFSSSAQIELSNLFSDNMVLQQESHVNIWGKAKKNQELIIYTSWSGKIVRTIVKDDGSWEVKIKTPSAGGPYNIQVTCDGETKTINNVLIGEVWLASGQSNMEMTLSGNNREPVNGSLDAIANSNNTKIRFFNVKVKVSEERIDDVEGEWLEANFKNTPNFSAVAYSFAKYLNQVLDIPFGIINSPKDGSVAEAWISPDVLKKITTNKELSYYAKQPHNNPSVLFNGMINAIIPFTIKGVIWYQGEGNSGRYQNYMKLMNGLIKNWRDEWGLGDFPFYFVQLAPNGSLGQGNGTSQAFLREAQLRTMLSVENTGMAVTLDIGSTITNHPPEKLLIGKRLAYWALAKNYGFNGLPHSGPVYESMKVKNNKVYVNFKFAKNGVTSYGKPLSGFEIAGEDKIFYSADASIDPHWSAGWENRSVLTLSNKNVPNPLYIRYGWKNYIEGALYNVEGLPASSFRSYDFD